MADVYNRQRRGWLVGERPPDATMAAEMKRRGIDVTGPMVPWKTGLYDCDCKTCTEAWCCPYCLWGYQYHFMKRFPDTTPCMAPDCAAVLCLDLFAGGCVLRLVHSQLRLNLMRRYHIMPHHPHSPEMCDFCIGCCCTPCSAAQMTREAQAQREWPGGICSGPPADGAIPGVQRTMPMNISNMSMGMGHQQQHMGMGAGQRNPHMQQQQQQATFQKSANGQAMTFKMGGDDDDDFDLQMPLNPHNGGATHQQAHYTTTVGGGSQGTSQHDHQQLY